MMDRMQGHVREAQSKVYHELERVALDYMEKGYAGMIVCISGGGLASDDGITFTATSLPVGRDEIDDPSIVKSGTQLLRTKVKGVILSTTLYDFRRTPYVKLDPVEGEGVEE